MSHLFSLPISHQFLNIVCISKFMIHLHSTSVKQKSQLCISYQKKWPLTYWAIVCNIVLVITGFSDIKFAAVIIIFHSISWNFLPQSSQHCWGEEEAASDDGLVWKSFSRLVGLGVEEMDASMSKEANSLLKTWVVFTGVLLATASLTSSTPSP
jgi:hypothetical protein